MGKISIMLIIGVVGILGVGTFNEEANATGKVLTKSELVKKVNSLDGKFYTTKTSSKKVDTVNKKTKIPIIDKGVKDSNGYYKEIDNIMVHYRSLTLNGGIPIEVDELYTTSNKRYTVRSGRIGYLETSNYEMKYLDEVKSGEIVLYRDKIADIYKNGKYTEYKFTIDSGSFIGLEINNYTSYMYSGGKVIKTSKVNTLNKSKKVYISSNKLGNIGNIYTVKGGKLLGVKNNITLYTNKGNTYKVTKKGYVYKGKKVYTGDITLQNKINGESTYELNKLSISKGKIKSIKTTEYKKRTLYDELHKK